MQYPYFEFSVPLFIKQLTNLKGVLAKAEVFARERKVLDSVVLGSRLYVDMFPLVRQVQIATDNAKGAAARLMGTEPPKMEDTEETFAALMARIDATITYLKTCMPEQFADGATREIRLPHHTQGKHFLGVEYLPLHAIPNFLFHVTTAYAILRHLGVDIGKADYVGGTPMYDDK